MTTPYIAADETQNMYPNLCDNASSSPANEAIRREELIDELHKIEEEIATLQAVLDSKVSRHTQLKRALGLYDFEVARDDVKRTLSTIKNSQPIVKTSDTIKTAAQKTSSAVSKQWSNVKQTPMYHQVETGISSLWKKVSFGGQNTGQQQNPPIPNTSAFVSQNPMPTVPPSQSPFKQDL